MSTLNVDTQIPVSSDTRDCLRACKRGGERYEDVIRRLMEETNADVSHASDVGE